MAPFKSEAQRRKFYAMAERGEIPEATVRKYEEKTKGDLPERISAKRKSQHYTNSKRD
jgi:hypothetical protein